MIKNRRLAACLTALVACAAGAETAAAADTITRTDYTVAIEGEAYFNLARITPTEFGDQTHQEDEQFKFRTAFPKISFWDHVGEDPTTSLGSGTGVRGHLADGEPQRCADRLRRLDGDRLHLRPAWTAPRPAGRRPTRSACLEAIQTEMQCGSLGPYPKRFDSLGAELGGSVWDDEFTVLADRDRPGRDPNPAREHLSPARSAPGFDEETTICELSWHGRDRLQEERAGRTSRRRSCRCRSSPTPPSPPAPAASPPRSRSSTRRPRRRSSRRPTSRFP